MDTQFKKAEEQFKKAIAIKPDFSEALNNLAVVAIHFGRYDEAVQLEEKALRTSSIASPTPPRATSGRHT